MSVSYYEVSHPFCDNIIFVGDVNIVLHAQAEK